MTDHEAVDRAFRLRGEFNLTLRRYLEGRDDLAAMLDWLRAHAAPDVDDPLRNDVSVVRETAEQVAAGERDEQELRELALSLLPQDAG